MMRKIGSGMKLTAASLLMFITCIANADGFHMPHQNMRYSYFGTLQAFAKAASPTAEDLMKDSPWFSVASIRNPEWLTFKNQNIADEAHFKLHSGQGSEETK